MGRSLLAAALLAAAPAGAGPDVAAQEETSPEGVAGTAVADASLTPPGQPAAARPQPGVTPSGAPSTDGPAPLEPAVRGEESVSEEGEPAVRKKERVRVFGRVYARASADERADFAREFDIRSARVGVRGDFDFVQAEVTADLADNNILKDAFVRVATDSKQLRLYGGRFKAPFLARELESTWDLPLLERGLVADYLTSTSQLGGRRMGLMGEVRLKGWMGLRAAAGVFEGTEDEELGVRASEDVAARMSLRPFEALTVGASGYATEALEGARHWGSAADATLRLGGLRLSAELATGRVATGRFDAQLGLLGYTLPFGKAGWAVEPVVGAEALQLRGRLGEAEGHALVGGVNLLLADRFKAQLQAERALRPGDERPGTSISVQLATRFF